LNVVLGAALWASSAITRKNLMNGAIVAGVISIVLIYFGGRAGQIGGIVGILGAILAAAKPYLPWSRHDSAAAYLLPLTTPRRRIAPCEVIALPSFALTPVPIPGQTPAIA